MANVDPCLKQSSDVTTVCLRGWNRQAVELFCLCLVCKVQVMLSNNILNGLIDKMRGFVMLMCITVG